MCVCQVKFKPNMAAKRSAPLVPGAGPEEETESLEDIMVHSPLHCHHSRSLLHPVQNKNKDRFRGSGSAMGKGGRGKGGVSVSFRPNISAARAVKPEPSGTGPRAATVRSVDQKPSVKSPKGPAAVKRAETAAPSQESVVPAVKHEVAEEEVSIPSLDTA